MPGSGAVELFSRFAEFFFGLLNIAGFHGLGHLAVLTSNGSFDGTVPCAFFLALTKSLFGTLCGWHGSVSKMKEC